MLDAARLATDNPGSSTKKRKESPTSIACIDEVSPASSSSVALSSDSVSKVNVKKNKAAEQCMVAVVYSTRAPRADDPQEGLSDRDITTTPSHANPSSSIYGTRSTSMTTRQSRRIALQVHTPSGLAIGLNEKYRGSIPPSVGMNNGRLQLTRKRRVKFAPVAILYQFFGIYLPEAPKIVALRCLEYLDGKNIYSMSLVSTLWNRACMDDALWE